MASPPDPIDAAPAVPVSTDPEATFDTMFEAFLVWLKTKAQPGWNALATNVFSNAAEAYAAAQATTAQAQAAIAAVNSSKWVTGTNYADGVTAWSPLNGRTYRTRHAVAPSTVDPALAPTDWWDIASMTARPMVTYSAGGAGIPGFNHLLTGPGDLVLPTTDLIVGGTVVEFLDISLSGAVALDPGPTNKIRRAAGKCFVRFNYSRATLVWAGSTDGWV